MKKQTTIRKYGKQHTKPKRSRIFAELPQTPVRAVQALGEVALEDDDLAKVTQKLSTVKIQDENTPPPDVIEPVKRPRGRPRTSKAGPKEPIKCQTPQVVLTPAGFTKSEPPAEPLAQAQGQDLKVLSWSDVCPPGDRIVKIAEASYAEVYRVTNERGTSIIKVIRMESPIKPQTKAQEKSGLVDEEPHSEADLMGELKISEWLADIPGFVVYKERYIVQGKACREVLETHQVFHKKLKRQDPDRLQFYPSPSRYLDGTKFLVVELGDAGTALEDFELTTADQLWDIFFHVTVALARAEAHIEFEHRDLHEGNLCIRRTGNPIPAEHRNRSGYFGFSGLEITILDYGLSRACPDYEKEDSVPVAYDMERDLSLFTSEHAAQCEVYRQMRSFLLRGDRVCLPPKSHRKPYEEGIDGPIDWKQHEPYTNVLWLAYTYQYMTDNFRGPKKELNAFKRLTKELWLYLNPKADDSVPGFESASDVVRFAVESGWIEEDQLMGGREEAERSILSVLVDDGPNVDGTGIADISLRRTPRRSCQRIVQKA
ncbi:hypothetical protein DL770_009342 [Monosporascus sp. CRB-9-2]|nr:hypothetical protein DL770_009342 [Monosporascus sp. CRB-9-2]